MTKILLAEDDCNIREGLVDTLELEGYDVDAAEHGKAAIEAFENTRPDLVVLDIMMPEMNGYDVCRRIRQTDKDVPIIMLTAKGEEIDKVLGLELGADDYITKPFGIRELLARIRAVLRRTSLVPKERDPMTGLLAFVITSATGAKFMVIPRLRSSRAVTRASSWASSTSPALPTRRAAGIAVAGIESVGTILRTTPPS